jgi:predicted Zn-dependent protease
MADSELSSGEQAVGRGRVVSVILIIVAVLVVGGVLGGLAYLLAGRDSSVPEIPAVTAERVELTLGATAQPFAPDRACGVYVVPVDGTSEAVAARLARALPRMVPVQACTTPSFRLDPSAVDHRREQVDAVIVADQLARAFQDVRGIAPATILGVTALDMYSSAFATDPFDFGVAKQFPQQQQGFAVVSTARMGSREVRFGRLETMAMRYVGLLYFGLPESSSPTSTSALAPSIRTLEDLDRLEPRFSDPQPSNAELVGARKEFLSRK